jgi:hypothetical protein
MRDRGTRKAGISSSGSASIGAVLISPRAPRGEYTAQGSDAEGHDEVKYAEYIPKPESGSVSEGGLTY